MDIKVEQLRIFAKIQIFFKNGGITVQLSVCGLKLILVQINKEKEGNISMVKLKMVK